MLLYLYIVLFCAFDVYAFKVPQILIEPLSPKGLKVSIPHVEGINLFVFHGQLNAESTTSDNYVISRTLGIHKNGKWAFSDNIVKWKRGDVLNYWTYIEYSDREKTQKYNSTGEQVIVRDSVSDEDIVCIRSVTKINGAAIDCEDTLIFGDPFHYFDTGKWDVEIYNPFKGPNFEFNSYEKDRVRVQNETLIIQPIPKVELRDVGGKMDVRIGCTSIDPQECRWQHHFLAAVKSGKITSKSTFKYGKIEIRAKLPAGDWIFPEVALVPKDKTNRATKIWIAYARGNENLQVNDGEDIGARLLFCGPMKSSTEPERSENLANKRETTPFTSGYHTYTLVWLPNEITCYVDNVKVGKVTTKIGFSELNTEFHISLGVGVAGNNDFPDGSKSGESTKPWKNRDSKQVISFFNARDVWSSTWKGDDSALKVDSVRVYSVSKESKEDQCINSETIVDGKASNKCAGFLVFEDLFDNLDTGKWVVGQFNPSGPNYEFSSYENSTVTTKDSNLLITPVPLLLDEEVSSQMNNIKNCAGFPQCSNPQEYFVLAKSGRITSRSTFKHAKIEVRAKLPVGDWLFTEISLVPKDKTNKETKIRIAYARGNQNLVTQNGDEIGASVLYCGPTKSSSILESDKHLLQRKADVAYSRDYHTYTLNWISNKITCSLDGVSIGEINTTAGFPELDAEFYISLGIGVGGVNDFPDNVKSDQHTKPWENGNEKNRYLEDFFAARYMWSTTWLDALKVDFIKVYAV